MNPLFAQMGIKIEDLQASSNINGNLKIRTLSIDRASSRVMVLDANNEVRQNTTFLSAIPLVFVEAIGATNISSLNMSLLTG